jgi:archaellum component FlaG (FlaF/FlaG flagellin family)
VATVVIGLTFTGEKKIKTIEDSFSIIQRYDPTDEKSLFLDGSIDRRTIEQSVLVDGGRRQTAGVNSSVDNNDIIQREPVDIDHEVVNTSIESEDLYRW